MTNEELIQKAVITADALASQGKLNDMQSNKFIDYVFDLSALKDNARIHRFRNENLVIDKIGVGNRVAMPKAEAVAPTGRRGVSTSKITLTPVEIIVPFEIGDTFSEINLEGASVEDHIVKMMARQLANDIEELYILGNTLGRAAIEGDIVDGGDTTRYIKDSYLALMDGWLELARDGANASDQGGVNIGASVFSNMLKAMPEKFKRDRSKLRFILSPDLEQNYREKVATRATQAGDESLSSAKNLTPFGVPLVPIPLFPFTPYYVQHVTLANDTTWYALDHIPVSGSEIVTVQTLAGVPTTKAVKDTDYEIDYTGATATGGVPSIRGKAGGAFNGGGSIKVTYQVYPQIVLTHMQNLVVGIGRDIRIEKDRDIYKGVNQYAITAKVSVNFEEASAVVFGTNIGLTV